MAGLKRVLAGACCAALLCAAAARAEGGRAEEGVWGGRHGPGPIRVGKTAAPRPARYSGRVEGSRMTLSVRLMNSDRPLADSFSQIR